jgi:hypothetical protein
MEESWISGPLKKKGDLGRYVEGNRLGGMCVMLVYLENGVRLMRNRPCKGTQLEQKHTRGTFRKVKD